MDPVIDSTPIMGEPERQKARRLTLTELRPPRAIPGYEQERFLGRGAFGEVWVAIDSNNGRKVAIKYYHRRGGLDWSLLSREVEKLRYLFGDRHVVQLLQVGWESDPPYYVMEYMENGSLEDLLREATLPIERALTMFKEIATGLVHAHGKGILHCDLKPANVMLDQDGQPRLADFGQSRLSHEHSPALGTLFYMAPEQADMTAAPDARWDVYALGAVVYRMLVGEPPYRNPEAIAAIQTPGTLEERLARYRHLLAAAPKPTAHRTVPGVDAALASIIEKCLAVNPRDRYPNVQAVLSALDARSAARARKPLLLLGGVGPLLVLLVILVVGGYEFARIIQVTEQEEKERARDLNRLAARAEADRLGWEVAARWQLLQQEATDPSLRAGLVGRVPPEDRAGAEKVSRWLVERQEYWGRRGGVGLQGTNWVVLTRDGYIRGCTEPDPERPNRCRVMTGTLGAYFGFRDYFHGRGQDMPIANGPPLVDPPRPITQPHRSAVFRQLPQNTFAVAYSTPIPSLDPSDPNPVGVLIMISDLVGATRLRGEDGRDRFLALVDTGRDEHGRRGLIIRHPYQEDYKDRPTELPLAFAPDLVEKAGYAGPYSDAVGREPWGLRFAVPWIAAIESVRVPVAPKPDATPEQRDTGWVVVVQETESGVVGPIQTLRSRLVWRSLFALLLVALLLGGLWLLVLVVLDAAPTSRVVQFFRRQVGLKSGLSGGTSSTSSSVSGASGSGGVKSGVSSHPAAPSKLPE
ncbi:MAG: serine/threonine protein kinase [Planctomycetes bacterium]|nr:serine/threonine protein kinase [Planctomycetota bacterium]